jgi:hypothetical protein
MNNQTNEPATEQNVSLVAMRDLIQTKRQLASKKAELNDQLKELNEVITDLDLKIIAFLNEAQLKTFVVPGVGAVTKKDNFSFKTPKTMEEKQALFDYIKNTYGEDVLMAKVGIDSRHLNAWAKEELENHQEDPLFAIPGLSEPSHYETLSFTKK